MLFATLKKYLYLVVVVQRVVSLVGHLDGAVAKRVHLGLVEDIVEFVSSGVEERAADLASFRVKEIDAEDLAGLTYLERNFIQISLEIIDLKCKNAFKMCFSCIFFTAPNDF